MVGGVYISENTPYKSIIPFLLSYYATSLDDPFGFCEDWHKIAQFWHILRNISISPRYAKLHEPDSDYLDPIDEISAKKSHAYLKTHFHKRSHFAAGLSICKKPHAREKSRSRIISIIMSKLAQNRDFSTFLPFESSDWPDITYYASIKWVELFAKESRSRKNLNFA